jgi:Holliday junction resolvasome RuvABC endonuclease subunit
MGHVLVLTGRRFGRLLVIERAASDRWGNARWRCLCACGDDLIARGASLRDGSTRSCGCLAADRYAERLDAERRLSLRTTAVGHVWGVDPALSRLAFAFADLGSETIKVETLITATKTTEGERLGLLDRQVRIFARQRAGEFPPVCVWVQPPQLDADAVGAVYAAGVVQAALFETLGRPVWTIPSATWKLRTVGNGNASKGQIAAWVASRGARVSGQGEADAYCIAVAGRSLLAAGERG